MTRKEIEAAITPVIDAYAALDLAFAPLEKAFGCLAETHLHDAVYRMFDRYLDTVARQVGDVGVSGNLDGWLAWYIYENQCGLKRFPARVGDRRMQSICTVKDLARLIYQNYHL